MDVIEGICVICSSKKIVLSNADKIIFLNLLKTYYFNDNQINYSKFLSVLNGEKNINSICLQCAYTIDCYTETIVGIKIVTRKKNIKRCIFCNSSQKIAKSTSLFTEYLSDFLKDDEKQLRFNSLCLRCFSCIEGWKQMKNSISKLLDEDSGSEINLKLSVRVRQLSTSSNESDSTSIDQMTILKRKSLENIRNNNKKAKRKILEQSSNSETRNNENTNIISKELEVKLKDLPNVNTQTITKDMNLSYSVITDKKMMFDIAYVACEEINKANTSNQVNDKCSQSKIIADITSKQEINNPTKSLRAVRRSIRKQSTYYERESFFQNMSLHNLNTNEIKTNEVDKKSLPHMDNACVNSYQMNIDKDKIIDITSKQEIINPTKSLRAVRRSIRKQSTYYDRESFFQNMSLHNLNTNEIKTNEVNKNNLDSVCVNSYQKNIDKDKIIDSKQVITNGESKVSEEGDKEESTEGSTSLNYNPFEDSEYPGSDLSSGFEFQTNLIKNGHKQMIDDDDSDFETLKISFSSSDNECT